MRQALDITRAIDTWSRVVLRPVLPQSLVVQHRSPTIQVSDWGSPGLPAHRPLRLTGNAVQVFTAQSSPRVRVVERCRMFVLGGEGAVVSRVVVAGVAGGTSGRSWWGVVFCRVKSQCCRHKQKQS